mgnify:CR=1 FL=1
MTLFARLSALSLFALLAACGGPGESAKIPVAQPAGATSTDIGDYVVHFSTQSTDQLPPDIARAYNILRSKNRAMLNVSVIRKSDNTSVAAVVEVRATNLTGQLKNVALRRIDEQEAVYYIGETAIANRETLVFDISVTPEGAAAFSNNPVTPEFYTDS